MSIKASSTKYAGCIEIQEKIKKIYSKTLYFNCGEPTQNTVKKEK